MTYDQLYDALAHVLHKLHQWDYLKDQFITDENLKREIAQLAQETQSLYNEMFMGIEPHD